MLPRDVVEDIAQVVHQAEEALLRPMKAGRVSQEPDMTSRLVQSVEIFSQAVDGVTTELVVVDGLGPGAAERDLGADIVGVMRVELGDFRASSGFLAQAKRSDTQGLYFREPKDDDQYSHWLYRGSLQLESSGIVSVSKPSADLEEQCANMLRTSPAAFVFVYDENQVGVVAAAAVHAARNKPRGSRARTELGTKRLDDFFVHLADGFVGDPGLHAADAATVKALAIANRARAGMLVRVSSTD